MALRRLIITVIADLEPISAVGGPELGAAEALVP